ncbi:MAG TPA: TonB-dependent receptor [Terriglobales bacterium]|nr:TonB-dependent receptor [Terriglobales bacterium]
MRILRNLKPVAIGLTAIALIAALSVLCFGQIETGSISGNVKDPAGAVVKGATVTVVSTTKGTTRTAITDDQGAYVVSTLLPDKYVVTFEAAGFAKVTQKIEVLIGSANNLSPILKVGSTSTTVEVSGVTAVEVQLQSQEFSSTIVPAQMEALPSISRDPYDLVATTSNADVDESGSTSRGVNFSLNGGRAAATDIQLDGAENSQWFGAGIAQPVPMDAVQEFNVTTSGLTADLGHTSAGVVNVATKSGTNDWHGSAYEFSRQAVLASNDYNSNALGIRRPGFERNQFGYSIGGPIKKDKMFLFSSTEWIRVRSSANFQGFVLDPAFASGESSPLAANTQAFFAQYGTLTGEKLGSVSAASLAADWGDPADCTQPCNPLLSASDPNFYAWMLANPNAPVFDAWQYTAPQDSGGGYPQNAYNTLNRFDWNLSTKNSLFARYARYQEIDQVGVGGSSPYVGYNQGNTQTTDSYMLSFTHVFRPTLVSDTKILFDRLYSSTPLGKNGVVPTMDISVNYTLGLTDPSTGFSFNTLFPGYNTDTPGLGGQFYGPQNYGEILEGLSWTRGQHTFKFGGNYIYTQDNRFYGAYQTAIEALSYTLQPTAMDALMTGVANAFEVAIPDPAKLYPCSRDPMTGAYIITANCQYPLPVTNSPSFARSNRFNDGAVYVNDTWKALPRLSLNLGVRWEYYGVQHTNHPENDSNFYLGTGQTIWDQVANGQVYQANASGNPVGGEWGKRKNNWMPRAGFAWDVFGDGKTSLRGGIGMGYERNFGNVTFNMIQNPTGQLILLLTYADNGSLPTPDGNIDITTNNYGPYGTAPEGSSYYIKNVTLRAVDPHIKTAYSGFWNIGIERQVSHNTIVDLTYTGSQGNHLYSIANRNQSYFGSLYEGCTDNDYGTGNYCHASDRLNMQYSNINWRGSDGFSKYNAMIADVRSSNLFNKGLTLNANWTWAHSMDNLSSTFSDGVASDYQLGYTDPFNPMRDRGPSDFDIRHRIAISAVWDIPFAKDTHGIAKQALDGWQLAPIYTFHTGSPFTVYDCNVVTYCVRAAQYGPVKRTGSLGAYYGSNTYNWLELQDNAAYQTPTIGYSAPGNDGADDQPTCLGPGGLGCTWPSNMMARNSFRGPKNQMTNLQIQKEFGFTERFKLDFRTEFYNLFNHANTFINGPFLNLGAAIDPVTGNSYVPAYKGEAPSSTNPAQGRRFIQLALRLKF